MPASMQGEMQPVVYRFKFGDFEITNIMDSKAVREGLHPSFGGERPAEEVNALARANHIPIVSVTETLSPASATFEQWQVAQLQRLERALHGATGR